MQILHVLEAACAGTATHVCHLIGGIPTARHHVMIPPPWQGYRTDPALIARLEALGATVTMLEMRRGYANWVNVAAITSVRQRIRSLAPDLVHGHSSVGGGVARVAALGTGVPVVYTPNGLKPSRLNTCAERILRPLAARVIAVSPSEAEAMTRHRSVKPSQIVTIRNGIPICGAPLVSAERLSPHNFGSTPVPLVAAIMRLSPEKAPLDLIEAWSRVIRRTSAHLVIVGDGPLRPAVEAELRGNLSESVTLLEPPVDVGGILAMADVFVLTSLREGGPYAPLEAMRAGAAVVLSDAVGNRDVIVGEESGLLYPKGDPAALADCLLRVITDEQLRRTLARNALTRLEQFFDLAECSRATLHLYRCVIGR